MNLPLLAVQLLVILVMARASGWCAQRVGQPDVVGEMLAGIALGPSLLGTLTPVITERLFPPASMAPLGNLSQAAVLMFMFAIGLRFDLSVLRSRASTAIAVSHTSIAVPFVLGVLCALYIYPHVPTVASAGSESDPVMARLPFALFIGAAMSVTAFPVMARILRERGLERTPLGAVALASAAVDDATAWGILACVAAFARAQGAATGSPTPAGDGVLLALAHLAVALAFAVALMRIAAPALARLLGGHVRSRPMAALCAVLYAVGAGYVTDRLGVHALFGTFVAGLSIPRTVMVVRGPRGAGEETLPHAIAQQLDRVGASLLLPLFFAFSGLRTGITLLNGGELWVWTLFVTAVAVVGKFGGSLIAARVTGMSWRDASAVGVLMNTRGLMALVVLNVGLDLALITPTVFAMMVTMALITTVMTSPLLTALAVGRESRAV